MANPVPAHRLNRLLIKLGEDDRQALRPLLAPVTLEYKRPLYEAHRPIEFVYFLESGVASLVSAMTNGAAAEVGTVGNEGVVGLPILLGDELAPTSMYMQVPGQGLQIKAAAFREQMARSATLRTLMLRYAHAFFNQVAQTAACAHFHNLEARCCRWLLMTRDRMPSDEFRLTHEFLAMMLGVRRAGVTVAAGTLQRRGYIRYERSVVTILDRTGLESAACECYAVAKAEFDRVLGADDDSIEAEPRKRRRLK
ncbi:MAG TPA: Crp/Fnr family transcriptional regulator [Stellaceae bacterium]|nr:Crp/Fnr family transcriptional regulator [Stellaceae bacterium]